MALQCEDSHSDCSVDVAVPAESVLSQIKHKLGRTSFPIFDKRIDSVNFG